jgi:hypothetical protein
MGEGVCPSKGESSASIKRAANTKPALVEDMGVNHGGFDIFMTEQFLDGADVVAVLEQVGGKTMAESVTTHGFVNFGAADGLLERSPKDSIV